MESLPDKAERREGDKIYPPVVVKGMQPLSVVKDMHPPAVVMGRSDMVVSGNPHPDHINRGALAAPIATLATREPDLCPRELFQGAFHVSTQVVSWT